MKQRIPSPTPTTSQAGFTIIELLIASLIFAVILVAITSGVLHFTTDYYKGVNSSTTQDAAARVMNNISQSIQFSNLSAGAVPQGPIQDLSGQPTPVNYVCVGSREFVYTLGVQYLSSNTNGLYSFNNGGSCITDTSYNNAATHPSWTDRQNLLESRMRLVKLSVDKNADATDTWNVSVTVAYGDADLLCDHTFLSGTGSCDPTQTAFDESSLAHDITNPPVAETEPDIRCKTQTGSQFCNVAPLTTTVQVRVQ